MRNLGTLGGANSRARGINDRGEVVGHSEVRPGSDVTRAFLWTEAGGIRGLGSLGGKNSFANVINNRREVAGGSETANGNFRAFSGVPARGIRSLGTLGGKNSQALDLNDATQVVGGAGRLTAPSTPSSGARDAGWRISAPWVARTAGPAGSVRPARSWAAARRRKALSKCSLDQGERNAEPGGPGGNPESALALGGSTPTGGSWASPSPRDPSMTHHSSGHQAAASGSCPPSAARTGGAQDIDRFGQIVGTTWTARNAIRATLWTPTSGARSR